MDFTGKVAIVTGAASGIGLACAQRLAGAGASVVLADIDAAKLEEARVHVAGPGGLPVATAVCDVGSEAQVAGAVAIAHDRFGRLDVVVNNAGMMAFKPIVEQTEDDWLRTLRVDLLGAVFFTKHALLRIGPGGAIVNVASVHAYETEPLVAPYAAAKAALLSLTRSASIEGRPRGIRVNAVVPGAVDTPMLWENPNVKSGVEVIDTKDVGSPDCIAAAVVWLASAEAGFVNGAALAVDGGRLARL
ncbi:NAD(P)-dependent dehydrogenase (short-subunit alcohol dehydrogenase family) [Pseudoduganella flava]|uniref:NAD(P)-dependent dehydrogenase (Short-subunit alcohol dehydrogenase family) n=2 Tax=Pseudoduganella flava TaxID=871742 RepID=A0A562PJ32_9BURK|nr:SDR family oxidoreductase [Pseudoduganella flava]TWI44471.1 NAD(P)-dependent dehydrogenase (short-subunit alcohol dehydrogenase family) [Pseudoduganella flava]